MRARFVAAGLAAGLAAAGALTFPVVAAGASPPQHVSQPVDYTVVDGYYTATCGFPVLFSLDGQLDSKVFRDGSGTVVKEIDTQPGTTVSFASASSSFSWAFASSLHTVYPVGDAIGSPATVSGDGLLGKAPGLPADAGRATFDGTVVALNGDGIPIVAFGAPTSYRGHANDPAAFDAALCSALAP